MARKFALTLLLLLLASAEAQPLPSEAAPPQGAVTVPQPLPAASVTTASASLPCQSQVVFDIFLPFNSRAAVPGQPAPASPDLNVRPLNAPLTLDRSVSYDIYEATRFLYTGSNPVQTGLMANTIDRKCVTVLRGNVTDRNGQPLPSVMVTLKDHPEFGQTVTDSNGLFNFVLNGGGSVVIQYHKAGYLPAQRRQETSRRQYVVAEPVVLMLPDAQATPINPSPTGGYQVAQGSVVSDGAGSRRATLLFPPGAFSTYAAERARLAMPAAPLTFRATEYTAGLTGAAAMPGDLPPTSGYTYAVDFSFDEPAGQDITFDQPIVNYTENLIGAPVGSAVPVGYYDDDQARWIPADDGRVIKILSFSGGKANLDVDGDGVADGGAALAELGVTDAERQQLASLYAAGQELWRVLIPHFSPWDFNWPFGPPDDAEQPPVPPPSSDQPGECSASGSVIYCDTQALGESLPVVGTPFTLNYSSRRVPGWKVGNILDIPITVGAPAASLKSIYLELEVGGQVIVKRWGRNSVGQPFGVPGLYSGTVEALAPNLTYRFVWDGEDGYGRATNGRPIANVMLRYVYDYQYYDTRDEFQQSFGQFGDNVFISNGREYCQYINYGPASATAAEFCGINMVVSYSRPLGVWDAAAAVGLGGWTLDVHHSFDPNDGVLHLGDGRDLGTSDIGPVMSAVIPDTSGINYMGDFTIAPDGTLYFIDGFAKHVMRLNADGSLTRVAGNGYQGMPTGDGGPATEATLGFYLNGLAVGPDGALYIAATYDNFNVGLIRRVDPDGIISTFAGTFFSQSDLPNGDGGPATAARLNNPEDILFGPDGSLYIAESPQWREAGGYYNRVRKITPDGIIHTIAGGGADTTPDADVAGIPALTWGALPWPGRMAFAPDGSLLLVHPNANTVSRIGPDGILRRLAGNGGAGTWGDGGAALDANVGNPQSVAVDENGVVFIRTRFQYYDRVRRITPDGTISSYAGRDGCTAQQDNNGFSARQACISSFGSNNSLELAPDGGLLVNSSRERVERIGSPQPDNADSGQTIYIPDPNGAEVYVFSSAGRHLRTLNALTGATLLTFGYDGGGRLTTISDVDDNLTQIERNGDGKPTALVAAGGQRTALTLTGSGYLRTVANPAGNTTTLAYNANGLLTSLTDPRGGTHAFQYSSDGRLTRDTSAGGRVTNLTRLEAPGLTAVTLTTGMGETMVFATEVLPNGDRRRTVTAPDGTVRSLLISDGSVWTMTDPDGTTQRVTYGPDPRWGMNAPLAVSTVITTSGSLVNVVTAERNVTLSTPGNPFSLVSLSESVSSNGHTWNTTYTAAGRTLVISSPAGRLEEYVLDAAGRVLSASPDGAGDIADTLFTYDSRGRLTQTAQSNRITQFGYSNANWLTSRTGPDGRSATMTYDAAGRMTAINLPGGRAVTFAFDAAGNQTSLTPPGRTAHTFSYTADNLPLTYTPPAVTGAGSSAWAYNADSNLTAYTRPGGGIVAVDYLYQGFRLGGVTLARGARSLSYDSAGRLQSTSDPSGAQLSYEYDGPLVTRRLQSGPVPGTVEVVYDNDWLIDTISVNGAAPIAYQYDADLLLTQAGNLAITRGAAHGLVTGSALGNVNDAWTYNAFGEAASYLARYNAGTLYQVVLTRDVNGRITSNAETIGGVTQTYAYTYDVAGRLTEVRRDGAVVGSYSYDANGNRLSSNGVSATYDAQDRLLTSGAVQYAYSANGELASKTAGSAVTTYQQDEVGNLLAVTLPGGQQLTYVVDSFNRRVGKAVNGTLVQGLLYQGAFQPVAELDGAGNVVSRFVYGARANVPEYMIKGGQTYRIVADPLGSPRLVVNVANGQVAQRLDYDVWGNVTQDTNPGFQPFGFAGGLYDRDTGLVRFGWRDYDPASGRWISKDPVGFAGGDSNLYAYVSNDPVNFIDPTGTADEGAPSPCNPQKSWDEKLREKGLDNLKKVPDWLLPKSLKQLKNGYQKLEKAEKVRDDLASIKENLESPDLRDTARALETGLDYVPQPVPLTPIQVVKQAIERGLEAVQRGIDGREGVQNSPNENLRNRWIAVHDDH